MSKSTKDKPYKGTKRDQYTIVLEDLRSKFEFFGDGLQGLGQQFQEFRKDFNRVERKVDVLDANVYVLKSDVSVLKSDMSEVKHILKSHNEKFDDQEERITTLENNS